MTPPESQRDRMIEALATVPGRDGWPLLCMTPEDVRALADAALAVRLTSDPAAAVARAEALANVLIDAPGQGPIAAAMIFAALAGGDAERFAEYERAALAQPAATEETGQA